jgi:DNA-binding CsgD family transcriptional regulator
VLPSNKDYARARRRIETALEQPHADAHAIVETFLAESADLLAIRSSCWHGTDPASGSMLDGATAGEAPGSFEESLVYEYRRPDVNRFADLRTGRDKAAAISTSTGNRLSASARFREMIEPTGVADELRVAFSDAYGMWMSLVLFTERRMTEQDLQFVADVVPGATSAMRDAVLSPDASAGPVDPPDGSAPSVLLLDAADRVISADPVARKRLALLPGPGGNQAPGVMSFLAARARWDRRGGPATARMRALDGRWFVIDVSLLDDAASGNVAAVVQPAPGELVLDNVLRAMGLSAREREVALLLAQGRPTKSIAAMLGLSPWTVQDHVKAVYAKTRVSRADLGSLGSARGHEPSALGALSAVTS